MKKTPLVPLREAELKPKYIPIVKMMRTCLYTPHSVTVDNVCDAFKINVDVRFVDSKTYRKFIIYHMVPFCERRIYERLGIELYKTLAMPAFMLCGVVPDTLDMNNSREVKSDFIRITGPLKRKDFTFDHPYFSELPSKIEMSSGT